MKINDLGGSQSPQIEPQSGKKYNKLRHDIGINANNGQRPPKVRSKTVPERHFGAQKAYDLH